MAYTKTIWENSPSENTPISAENLNNIENGIEDLDTRLTTAEGEIDTAQTDINNAEAVIGNETDTYSASSTYALGSLVIYSSLLYKCTTAITVAEAWNIAKWTQIDLVNISDDLRWKKIWVNPNPNSAFESQNITLINSNYDELMFVFDAYANYNQLLTVTIFKGSGMACFGLLQDGTNALRKMQRLATRTNDTTYNIGTSIYNYGSSATVTTDNSQLIPLYVLGRKSGIFS